MNGDAHNVAVRNETTRVVCAKGVRAVQAHRRHIDPEQLLRARTGLVCPPKQCKSSPEMGFHTEIFVSQSHGTSG